MPEISQPAVVGRILGLPEPLAPPFTRAVFPEFADLGNRELSFDLGPLFRQWSWTWDYWPWTSYWPDLRDLARAGFFRPEGIDWTSSEVQCFFCGVRIDEWEEDDDIDGVHVELTLGQVGEPGYGTRHSQGCLFALHRREHVRWEAGLGPEAHRRRQVGLYRARGPEVSNRGPPSHAFSPWWERANVEHENFLHVLPSMLERRAWVDGEGPE